MKKLFVHLSLLCLLVALAVPMIGCHKDEAEVEESTTTAMSEPATTEAPMGSDMGGGMAPMGSDMGSSEPMGTDMTPPPAQ
ncbi:MAG TPA: hypothetical protein VEW48_13490 [Thermoanaerobaculia bacterium]|nr:hypothetical protein [Thermoanaerobaculia bacterium]